MASHVPYVGQLDYIYLYKSDLKIIHQKTYSDDTI